jgi:hypothetical protein
MIEREAFIYFEEEFSAFMETSRCEAVPSGLREYGPPPNRLESRLNRIGRVRSERPPFRVER